MKTFMSFLKEEKEITVGDYRTKYHYMCPSAVKFLKKHMKMDHNVKDLEKIAKLSDEVFKIEAKVEDTGKSSEEQITSAEKLTDKVYNIVGNTAGVETLDILTPYRFRIAIGKMFVDRDVMSTVRTNLLEYIKDANHEQKDKTRRQ